MRCATLLPSLPALVAHLPLHRPGHHRHLSARKVLLGGITSFQGTSMSCTIWLPMCLQQSSRPLLVHGEQDVQYVRCHDQWAVPGQ